MRKLKIGYWPLSSDLKAPGDRRRVVFWAQSRGHLLVTDRTQSVDVIVATENSDFNSKYFEIKTTPVIFDLVDAYLSPLNLFDDIARGAAKKFTGAISGEIKPFSHHVRDFCERSDAVISSSTEQEDVIKKLNRNTHVILDSHSEIPFIKPLLKKFASNNSKGILWEGQVVTLHGIRQLIPVFSELSNKYDLSLNFVTDQKYRKILNRFFEKDTLNLLNKTLNEVSATFSLTDWGPENLLNYANRCVASMIPIDLSIPMQNLKPENRLLIMWRLGLPCLTSPSPAYKRVADEAGVNATCQDLNSWLENFNLLLDNPTYAFNEVLKGQDYVRDRHNSEILLRKWDAAFESVLDQI